MTANLKLRYLKKRKIDLYKNQFFISYDTIGATLLFIVIQILTSLFSFEEKKSNNAVQKIGFLIWTAKN